MVAACFTQDFAWAAAAFIGFICLLSFGSPAIELLPVSAALSMYFAAFLAHTFFGPRMKS